MKFKYFQSLSYDWLYHLVKENGCKPVTVYYFTIKTDPANVSVTAPSECKLYFNNEKRLRLLHEGGKKENVVMKPHSFYFQHKHVAERHFNECVSELKEYLDKVKSKIDHSLHYLDKY